MNFKNYLNMMANLWKINAENKYKQCVKRIDNNFKIIQNIFEFLNYND